MELVEAKCEIIFLSQRGKMFYKFDDIIEKKVVTVRAMASKAPNFARKAEHMLVQKHR